MMLFFKRFLLLIFSLPTLLVTGQSLQTLTPSIPTSPQAEAIKMHGNYNIDMSTGSPDISIPLLDIDHRGFKMPVSLRYAARPLRPGYNFDAYGIGWSLSVSSCISRSIEYVPDEWKNFKLENPPGYPSYTTSFGQCSSCFTDFNYAHDKFNAVLPDGSSFDFIIDNNNNNIIYKVSDGRQVKIDCIYGTSQITSFSVIDENGVKFTFAGADEPRSGSSSYPGSYVSWLLSQIDLPESEDPILFNYNQINSPSVISCLERTVDLVGSRIWINGGAGTAPNYEGSRRSLYPQVSYQMRLLTSIVYGPQGKDVIQLTYNQGSVASQTYQVDKIKQFEGTTLINEINLTTSMHGSNNLCYAFPLATLDQIIIKGKSTGDESNKYTCYYSGISAGGTDHWGYMNYQGTDLPNFNFFCDWPSVGPIYGAQISQISKDASDVNPFYKYKLSASYASGSDCRAASDASAHGIMTKIVYPTGGYTTFDFENHKFLTSTTEDGNYIYEPQNRIQKNAAGFRIRKITNYTSEGVVSGIKNYRYGKTLREIEGPTNGYPGIHTGVGEAVVDPNIVTYLGFATFSEYNSLTYSPAQMVIGVDESNQRTNFGNPFYGVQTGYDKFTWECHFSALNFRRVLGGRQPVVYPEVTEYDGEMNEGENVFPLGKTVYKYDISSDYTGESFFEQSQYYRNTLLYEPKPYLYRRLKEKSVYKYDSQINDFKKLRMEVNTWTPVTESYSDWVFGDSYVGELMFGPFVDAKPWYYGAGIIANGFEYRNINLGKSLMTKQEFTEYDPSGSTMVTEKLYNYSTPMQLTSTASKKSDGRWINNYYQYPGTYIISGSQPLETSTSVVDDMITKNMITKMLRSTTSVDGTIIAGNQVKYDYVGSPAVILPVKSYQLERKPSGASYELQSEVKSYSPNANPLEIMERGGVNKSYIWGYDDRYMTASITNAKSGDVAFSSFENSDKGNWSYSGTTTTPSSGTFVPTGRSYYNLTPSTSLDKTVINGQTYIVSYWASSTSPYTVTGGTGTVNTGATIGGWTYFQHKVTAAGTTLSISGTGGLDEIRLCPSSAQMTTYTYDPLIGITSQTDANGRTTYYEYDNSNRLQAIKDQSGNILRTYDYKYQQTP